MQYIDGNLLDMADAGEFDIVVHGCNCFQKMGRGIAKDIKARYPEAYVADLGYGDPGQRSKLGTYSKGVAVRADGTKLIIINAYTQFTYWDESDMLDYDAVSRVFAKIAADFDSSLRIGIPKIGAGLAKGKWSTIEKLIDDAQIKNLTCVNYVP